MSKVALERVWVAGMPVVRAGLDEASSMILSDAAARHGRVYVFVNAHSAKLRRESDDYARVL
jgi:UDP-N-acetyl-D-mannosaminuronic acid transferase (WecB/TagA/CpsF family)